MRFISEQSEGELEYQESRPFNISGAREVLEKALTEQFRNLADAVLAALLLKNVPISELTWWQYFLTRAVEVNSYYPDHHTQSFVDFRNALVRDIATRKVKALSFSDLGKVEIRIFGGFVKLWDEGKINKQLARLGSSYRFTFLGSHALTVNRLLELLRPELAQENNDPRFIWGEVDHLTATPFGLRFNYIKELAISPLMDEGGEGFNFDTTVVIRENLIRSRLELSDPEILNDAKKYEVLFDLAKVHVTVHELLHAASFHSKLSRPYREAFWSDDLKRDICRFTQLAREPKELRDAFAYIPVSLVVDELNKYLEQDKQINLAHFFESLLEEMKGRGLIEETPEGKFFSSIYEDGKIWVA